jgi:hypothetical protein
MGIELSPLDITYEKRKAIKSQVLQDFYSRVARTIEHGAT